VKESIKESVITFRPRGLDGFVSAHLIQSRTRLTPSIRGDEWKIRLRITSQANLIQNESSLDPLDPKQVKQIEKSLNDEISERIERALRQAQQELNADVFGFADVFRRSYPKQWNRARKDWDEIFPRVKVTIDSDIRLERPGFSGK
jgi:spore germination protein KC